MVNSYKFAFEYKKVFILLLVLLSFSSNSDTTTTLQFTYNIEAAPCNVVINGGDGDQNNVYVKLGDIPSQNLNSPGDYSEWKNFDIELKNCPETTVKYVAKFDGTPATADVKKYNNDGSATHVQVELQSQAGDILDDNSTLSGDIINSSARLNLRARAYSAEGGATGGGIHSAIQLTFTYS